MIKIFKKGLTASEGCRWGLSGSWYGCWRFIRGFGWVCVACAMLLLSLAVNLTIRLVKKEKPQKVAEKV